MPYAPRTNRDRQPAVPMQLAIDPAAWTPDELAAKDDWIYELSGNECDQIVAAVDGIEKRGLDIKNIRKDDFQLAGFADDLAGVRDEFLNGRGFVLIRGVPVADMTREQSAIAFWGIGAHLGRAVSQNGKGH